MSSECNEWFCWQDPWLPDVWRVLRANPDGNMQCLGTDGRSCLLRKGAAACNEVATAPGNKDMVASEGMQPLICGTMHEAALGNTGYDDPRSFCSLALAACRGQPIPQVVPPPGGEQPAAPAVPQAVSVEEQAAARAQLMAFRASFQNGAEVLPYFTGEGDPCTWHPMPPDEASPQGVSCDTAGNVTRMCVRLGVGTGA